MISAKVTLADCLCDQDTPSKGSWRAARTDPLGTVYSLQVQTLPQQILRGSPCTLWIRSHSCTGRDHTGCTVWTH